MEFRQLEYFAAIARDGGFRRAADRLGVAQASLSREIKQLETELRVQLFRRTSRTVSLTEAGLSLLPYAERALADVRQARDAVSPYAGPQGGSVSMATLAAIATPWTPALVAAFTRRYPLVRVHIVEGNSNKFVESFAEGEIDVAWLLVPDSGWEPPAGVRLERVRSGAMVFFTTQHHPLARRGSVALEQILGEPLLVPSRGSSMRAIVDQTFKLHGMEPRILQEVRDQITLIQLASQGLGVGITWSGLIPADAGVVMLRVEDASLLCSLALAWRDNSKRTEASAAFASFAFEWVHQHVPITTSPGQSRTDVESGSI